MGRIEEIDREIEELTARYHSTTGRKAEVYSRIVGYYRSLDNWNRGKREEFDQRITFIPSEEPQVLTEPPAAQHHYELYTRETCPACPPMKSLVAELPALQGNHIDVDTEEGLIMAKEARVYATPTLILYSEDGEEIERFTDPVRASKRLRVPVASD